MSYDTTEPGDWIAEGTRYRMPEAFPFQDPNAFTAHRMSLPVNPPVYRYPDRSLLAGRWSLAHAACIGCGTTERRHVAGGRCTSCYWRDYRALKRRSA